ncbi:hypothetical protein Hypma_007521 [Hypsizygus marmoreus]|uniref:Uncharacterized protein n=1 Tax=Hypsizygus marmoreus TaxID=39966 RepID=A0A369K0C1_HYPMA|nr:hypothetical protein Hypma_007521 [Hypsizygus marmoreus]
MSFSEFSWQIGYYHLCGANPAVLHHTAFCDFESVFSGSLEPPRWRTSTGLASSSVSHDLLMIKYTSDLLKQNFALLLASRTSRCSWQAEQ